jgi:hypothetical protein
LKKKRKQSDSEEEEHEIKEEKKSKKKKIKIDPVILMFTCQEPNDTKWKLVCNSFKEANPDLNISYMRFKDKLGHIAVIPDEEEDDIKFTDKFTYDNVEYSVKKCENEDLIEFYKEHGKHFESCVQKAERKNKKNKKNEKNKEKKGKNANKGNGGNKSHIPLNEEVTIGEEKFDDAVLIRNKARQILNDAKDDEKLKDKEHKFILDLLKYHHKYDEKVKDLDYITVGKPEKFDTSRCFLIVKKDKTKDDFSIQKCIDNLVKKVNGEDE